MLGAYAEELLCSARHVRLGIGDKFADGVGDVVGLMSTETVGLPFIDFVDVDFRAP